MPKEKWRPDAPDFKATVVGAAESLRNTKAAFLDTGDLLPGRRRKLCVKNISFVHELKVDFSANPRGVLSVEGAQIPVATKAIAQGGGLGESATKGNRAQTGCMIDVANACRLLSKQRLALEQSQGRKGEKGQPSG